MSNDAKVNYYEVMQDTAMHELDEANGFAFPVKNEKGNKWIVNKGQYVKSFGQLKTLKNTDKVKETYLLLVNGNGVILKDVTLYQDEVDDCGCDMMPIAKPTDLEKLEESKSENNVHKPLNKNDAYLNKKGKFDKSGIIGFVLGAAIGGGVLWFKTKDKKKAMIGAIAGAVIGMVIGYLIGRRGTKKIADVNTIDEIEKVATNTEINESTGKEEKEAETQQFLQLGQEYDFTVPFPIFALVYAENAFYVARDKDKNQVKLNANTSVRGKLVEVKEPELFILDNKGKKVSKVKNKKPLPFLEIGKNLYVPLAMVDKNSMIATEEVMNYMDGQNVLDEEIYVKGRYAGKKYFYLMYMPTHDATIRSKYGIKK